MGMVSATHVARLFNSNTATISNRLFLLKEYPTPSRKKNPQKHRTTQVSTARVNVHGM